MESNPSYFLIFLIQRMNNYVRNKIQLENCGKVWTDQKIGYSYLLFTAQR